MKVTPAALVFFATLVVAPAQGGDRITGKAFATRSEVYAPEAMAATSHPLATQIALDTMRQGGSAMDAAIAANAALGLMEPTGSGIGGDLFAIVWDPGTSKLYGYNGSGRSPKALSLRWLQANGYDEMPQRGPLPVTVPGAVDAWFALHARFGRRTMAQNLAPTVAYARSGHAVHEVIAYYWNNKLWRCRSGRASSSSSPWTARARPRERAKCGATRTWPIPSRPLAAKAATPSTRARWPAPSTPSSAPTRASCATRTWPRTPVNGWPRSA